MTTEILRRGDDLSPHSQADGIGQVVLALTAVVCINGCGVPMQPLDSVGVAYRCSACAEVTVDRRRVDLIEREATSTLDRALFELLSVRTLLAGAVMGGLVVDARVVMASLSTTIGLLTSAPAAAYADTIHTAAIGYATRICARRSESLFTDSKNPIAGNEAAKCAFAIQRIRDRASLKELVESSVEFPEAAHA